MSFAVRSWAPVLALVLSSPSSSARFLPASRESAVIAVTVADRALRPVEGLTVGDFAVQSGATDAVVVGVRKSSQPLAIVIIADGLSKIDTPRSRAAMREIVDAARHYAGGARIGVMSGPAAKPVALTDFATAERAIAGFYDDGRSAPVDEFMSVAIQALAKQEGRRLIFVISDQSVMPSGDPKKVASDLQGAGIELWVVASARLEAERPIDNAAFELSIKPSGGRQIRVDQNSLDVGARTLSRLATSAYEVQFSASDIAAPLRVGVRRPGVTVAAPTKATRAR